MNEAAHRKKTMSIVGRIESEDGSASIDVVRRADGVYVLWKTVRRYDDEEQQWYEIRETPNPGGLYGDIDIAIAEARTILGVGKVEG